MQLNTLNRVIALFLIGGFVVLLTAVALEPKIRSLVEPYSKKELSAATSVFVAVALLSVTALAGSLVDAIGNLTVRRLIRRKLAVKRNGAMLFFSGSEFDERDQWQSAFERELNGRPKYNDLLKPCKPDTIKALSAAMFFRTAGKEHTEWLIQHHSMYHLSANFVVILISCAVWSLFRCWPTMAAVSLVGAYLLTSFSLDNYLYTYQLSFRNAYVTMIEPSDLAVPKKSESES